MWLNIDDRVGKEMGVKFKITRDYNIEELSFNITTNDFSLLKFRDNFYKLEKGLLGKLLNKQDIIFEIKDNHLSWYNLNLQLFDLFFCKDIGEILLTVQCLESVKSNPNSKLFLFSTKIASTKSFFYREKSMAKWINYKSKPSFYLTL